MIELLASFGLEAFAKPDAPGVYLGKETSPDELSWSSEDAKIAALGLRIRRGCSYHGVSLNVDMDLGPFSLINPCGYENQAVCQLKDFDPTVSKEEIGKALSKILAKQLNLEAVFTYD